MTVERQTLNPLTARDWGWALVLASVGALYHLSYAFYGPVNLIDTGIYVSDAMRILDGEVYGREFTAPYGPLSVYALAAYFELFGENLRVANVFWVSEHFVLNAAHFLLARRLLPRTVAMVPCLCLIVAYGPLHKAIVNLVFVLAGLVSAWVLANPSLRRAVVAGIAFVILSLCRWDSALFAGVACTLALALEKREEPGSRRVIAFLATVVVGAAIVTGLYAWLSNPSRIFLDTWDRVQITKYGPTLGEGHEGQVLASWLENPVTLSLFAGALLTVLIGWGVVIRAAIKKDRSPRNLLLLVMVVIGTISLNQVYMLIKYARLAETWAVTLVLTTVLAWACLGPLWNRGRPAKVAVVLLMCIPFGILNYHNATATWYISGSSWAVRDFATETIDLPRAGTRTVAQRAHRLEELVPFVQSLTQPGEPIFVTPNIPDLYFLCDRPNITRVSDFLYIYKNPKVDREIVETCEERGVRVVVSNSKPIMGHTLRDGAPQIASWIERNFRPVRIIGKYTVWVRR